MNKVEVAKALLEAVQNKFKVTKLQAHQRRDLVRRILAKARISSEIHTDWRKQKEPVTISQNPPKYFAQKLRK